MDMENKTDELEFDLDDILNEFLDLPEDAAAVEPDEELDALLKMPELSFPSAVPEEPDFPEYPQEPEVSREDTLTFEPVSGEQLSQAISDAADSAEEASVSDDDTIALPSTQEAETPQRPAAEPAFEIEEVFIPSPIMFAPKSRLKELKKQLVAGPEKR